jgi:hypothetical protein
MELEPVYEYRLRQFLLVPGRGFSSFPTSVDHVCRINAALRTAIT